MTRLKFFPFVLGLLLLMPQARGWAQTLEVRTELGPFELVLYPEKAPVTVANFLRYVDAGLMKNTHFYRTVTINPDNQEQSPVKIEVIQGGWRRFEAPRPYPDIRLETTQETGLKHLDGTISMARDKPNSANSEFFICVGDQAELDFGGKRNPDGRGFAAFGRVTRGLDVVRAIHQSANSAQDLKPPIRILGIRRVEPTWFTEAAPKPYSPAERVVSLYRAIQSSAKFWLQPSTQPRDFPSHIIQQLSPFLSKSGLADFQSSAKAELALKILDYLTPELKTLFDQLMNEIVSTRIDRVTQSIEGDQATVTLSLRSRDFLEGKTKVSQETFRLYREDGIWYLQAEELFKTKIHP